MSTEQPPSRLRWRCRRGMQELDVLLGGWLEHCWAEADVALRESFDRLLDVEDDRIWDWLLGRGEPDARMKRIVEAIRARQFGRQS